MTASRCHEGRAPDRRQGPALRPRPGARAGGAGRARRARRGTEEMGGPGTRGPGPGRVPRPGRPSGTGRRPAGEGGRVARYYARLLAFAARTDARLFHILWFRRFPVVERMLLVAYLQGPAEEARLHGPQRRRPCAGRENGRASRARVPPIPLPDRRPRVRAHAEDEARTGRALRGPGAQGDRGAARPQRRHPRLKRVPPARSPGRLGFGPDDRVLLFFGNIAPYKGAGGAGPGARDAGSATTSGSALLIAGRVKDRELRGLLAKRSEALHRGPGIGRTRPARGPLHPRRRGRAVLPGGGCLDAALPPGRPVGRPGALVRPGPPGDRGRCRIPAGGRPGGRDGVPPQGRRSGSDLAGRIRAYFASELYRDLETRCRQISDFGAERFSWATNAERTFAVYECLLWNGSAIRLDSGLRGSV